jgi:hypothetical protein
MSPFPDSANPDPTNLNRKGRINFMAFDLSSALRGKKT